MIFGYFTLFVALLIEVVGAYYSITGLAAIFSGAVVPILIMGGSLEVGKVTAAVWLKNNWHRASLQFKLYLLPAVTLLMFITSMGIFGFLSKAHNDQNLVSGDVLGKIAIYDEKIKIQRDNIESARRALQQMDAAVDQTMSRSTSEQGADKATAIRRGQARERTNLQNEISRSQTEIVKLNDQRAPIAAEVRKVEAEVGPIKYIAKMIYGDNPDANLLEQAVVWVIMMIVAVFDPLALVLILAAQQSIRWARGEDTETKPEFKFMDKIRTRFKKKDTEGFVELDATELDALNKALQDSYEPKEPVITDELTPDEIDRINKLAAEYAEPSEPDLTDYSEGHVADPEPKEELPVVEKKPRWSGFSFPLLNHFTQPKVEVELEPVAEEPINPNAPELDASDERPGDYIKRDEPALVIPELVAVTPPKNLEAAPGRNRGIMAPLVVQADNAPKLGKATNSGFGNEYPTNPEKGDVYLRTDYLPNRLFKFNGSKWIEVDKNSTDVYAYDELYIKHLISEIDAGRYDPESLSDVEREQIKQYLGRNA
ncbi:hypothetical protein UFOVP112_298 [uncultured Caudovirales phage]|uniref:DUF4407 domain-containing protein n=1 Tax=uncultured Caudovirales phage TaxID=2100421 RepID=A0A6J5L8X8_9CAUD|nr:hypothetical protein UFOVP112_298 [uncultured Caudovirales phage]